MKSHLKYIIFSLVVFLSSWTYAQRADEVFGKNKVQYKNLKWKYIISKHFVVYYYQGGNQLAHNAARYAEEDLERIRRLIGFEVDQGKKITLIIYNSFTDLQQSNIGIEDYYLIGGQANLIKIKAEIAFPGTQVAFKKEISARISHLLVNVMMFGGSLKDMVQNAYTFNLPDWFIEGVATYSGYGWDAKSDNAIRNLNISKLKKPSHADINDAKIIGHSIWSYIAETYGESAIANILHITGIVKNVEVGISSSLAVSYDLFVEEWKKYYAANNGTSSFAELNEIPLKYSKKRDVLNVSISPDKRRIAYTRHLSGKYQVIVHDIAKNESKVVFRGGAIAPPSKQQPYTPLLSWKANGVLGVMHYRKGYLELVMINVSNGDKSVIPFKRFEQVVGMDFSDDKKRVVFSAVQKGRTDLYEYDLEESEMAPLTADLFDERDPVYLPGTYQVLFSGNRLNDTLKKKLGLYHQISENYELFVFTPEVPVLKRLTYTETPEYAARPFGNNEIVFRKEFNFNSQLFRMRLDNNEVTQITAADQAVEVFDLQGGTFAIKYQEKGKSVLRFQPDYVFSEVSSPARLDTFDIVISDPLDTLAQFSDIDAIDINALLFESDAKDFVKDEMRSARDRQSRIWLANPRKYKKLMGIEQVTSTFLIDQLRGSGVLMQFDMEEMMGDHFIRAGVLGLTDLKSSSFSGEYRYLKRREDYYLSFDKQAIFALNLQAAQRYTSNTIDLDVAYPLNISNRVALSSFFTSTRYVDLNVLSVPDVVQNYVGFGGEYVFDNTKVHGMNMIEGTRGKVTFNAYQHIGDGSRSFGKFKFDVRHYQKIHRDIIFATRVSGGAFTGQSKKSYLLGGMDNWLFADTDFDADENPLDIQLLTDNSDLLFVDYATGMRGFNYNKRNGNKFLLFNAELRLPLAKYLHRSPISSTFFRNLQLVTFYDLGAAWSGNSPFSRDNSFNTQVVGGNGNPFTATVTNYRSPFLGAYGVGARTVLLGYYMKLDVAWGVENFTVSSPRVYITFGYDF